MVTILDNANGMAFAEFELALPNKPGISLNKLVAYEKSELTETTHGIGVYNHQFITQQPELVDKTLNAAMATGTPRIRFRIGYGTPEKLSWLPWQNNIITHYSGLLVGAGDKTGHHLQISTSDMLFAASRASKTCVRKGTISGIVAQIAQENKLTTVIEKTAGEFTFIQSFEDDVTFISTRLVPRAVSTKNRGSYLFFMQDNVLHFHSLDYQAEIKDLFYFETPYLQLAQVDMSQQLWDEGASGTRLIVYDPYTGQSQEIISAADKALRLANGIYDLTSVVNGQRNIIYTLGQNRPEEAVALGQNSYEFARLKTFELVATFSRLTNLRVGNIIRLIVSPLPEKTSPWSGYYLLSKTVTTLDKTVITVTCQLQRGEISQFGSKTVAEKDAQTTITKAPGVELNVRETQDSAQTKGAGKQASAKVYTTVADVNSIST